MSTANTTIRVIRCKAFSGEGVRLNRVLISADGTVRVYDAAAGYYTTMHSLSQSALRRIRKAV